MIKCRNYCTLILNEELCGHLLTLAVRVEPNLLNVFFPQVAGGRNVPPAVLMVAIKSIENSRQMRYQSLNAYRKRFNMKPYTSFEDLTGETIQNTTTPSLFFFT